MINVKPYPEGKPADFTGAVGSFTLAAFADMKSVKANEAITLKDFLKQDFEGNKYIAHCEEGNKTELRVENIEPRTLILIGPEGDFSTSEIEIALQNQFKAVSLGTSRLRTETAGIVAVHTINIKD